MQKYLSGHLKVCFMCNQIKLLLKCFVTSHDTKKIHKNK